MGRHEITSHRDGVARAVQGVEGTLSPHVSDRIWRTKETLAIGLIKIPLVSLESWDAWADVFEAVSKLDPPLTISEREFILQTLAANAVSPSSSRSWPGGPDLFSGKEIQGGAHV